MSKYSRTFDCPPNLADTQVLDFCKNGFVMLDGVVPREINERCMEYLAESTGPEPSAILKQDWFMDNVICHPLAAGAVRSLLGKGFGLPILMSNHRVQTPVPAQSWPIPADRLDTPYGVPEGL